MKSKKRISAWVAVLVFLCVAEPLLAKPKASPALGSPLSTVAKPATPAKKRTARAPKKKSSRSGTKSIAYSTKRPEYTQYVRVYWVETNKTIQFYADNTNYCPYQVQIRGDELQSYFGSNDYPLYAVVKPQQIAQPLFSIPVNRINVGNLRIVTSYALGDPFSVFPSEDYPYFFPFHNDTEHRITQYYNTRYSHRGTTKYSIDFSMDMKTPVCAARDGVVVAVKVDSKVGGRKRRYRSSANYVTVYQDDGTFAQYVHLSFEGSLVKVGERVKAGQEIALSGNTGWTSGPHLHFMVFVPTVMGRQSVPTAFLTRDGLLEKLQSKSYYTAFHPDAPLDVTSGVAVRNGLTNAPFVGGSADTNLGAP